MANEEKKDFNAMLRDSKDMPKLQILTDPKSIEKYGGDRMYFAPPIDYDRVMKRIPYGKLTTVGEIRAHFARENQGEAGSRGTYHPGEGQNQSALLCGGL